MSGTTFANGDGTFFGESSGVPVSIVNPNTGTTATMQWSDRALYINNSGTLAALTIKLPKGVQHGELIWLGFKSAITALTIQDGFGVAIGSAPSSAAANGIVMFRYLSTTQFNVGWILAGSFDAGPDTFSQIVVNGFLFESASNAVTAFAGGGQASATLLTSELNRVATVATAGDSVKLPSTAAMPANTALTIIVENAAANPMQVFGSGTDTINGVATATGVSQMPGSVVVYTCYAAGAWFANGLGTGYAGSLETVSFANGVTAAGTTQATATPLSAMYNNVSTVASGTGVNLPASAPGLLIGVANTGANPLLVYPLQGSSDTINGVAAANGVVILPGSVATFACSAAGAWAVQPGTTKSAAFNTNSATAGTTLTAANITGGAATVDLALTGALGGAANAQLPTVASMVLALHSPTVGTSFRLRIINESSGAFAWTVTTNTGWTLTGTMSIPQNTWRDFVVTLNTLTTATIQNVGTGTFS